MLAWWRHRRDARTLARRAIPDALWQQTLADYPFLALRNAADQQALRELATLFLADKEFAGGQGLQVSDAMAVAIAAQACLPVLKLGLSCYDGFKGIVVHADVVVAKREIVDDDGVVHAYEEELSGEAMEGGPVMLSWQDVAEAGSSASISYNVVIHEFAHVLDMRDGMADGVPPLPSRAAREQWCQVLDQAFEAFCGDVDAGIATVLDPYGAESVDEFFAVAAEAFFVAPADFRDDQPQLYALFKDYFAQDPAQTAGAR